MNCRKTLSWRIASVISSSIVVMGLVAGCSGANDGGDVVTVQQEDGGELMVDWDEGLTYEQQVEEIKLVNEVMTKHFGEKVLRLDGDEWDLEKYLNWPGIPYPSNRGEDAYYFEVKYDFSDVKPGQETQDKALAVMNELGLTPNNDLPTEYDPDRSPSLYIGAGKEEHGHLFMIRQRNSESGIRAIFWTRHSDHESMRDAAQENLED